MKAIKFLLFFSILPFFLQAQDDDDSKMKSATFSGLKWRSVGPALTSGRVGDFAVHPDDNNIYYVATASGGVWKTVNDGTTYEPIFDGQGSYSIGCVTLDPNNPNVVWVGTGENNNQRSVGYGDGVYKSTDGGQSWTNMGLKESEHIGMITIDPRNSNVIYVAAYGPLWSEGGERGLYKSTDRGESWEKVLDISKYTGINEVHLDPRNPDVIYATAHQRMRKVWTYIGGGQESAIYKSTDGGENWDKVMKGLPSDVDLGRIGMDVSPVDPDVLYAIVEAAEDKSGFFRSNDRGASWTKMSDESTSGNYYQEVFCDPVDVNKVYIMDTWGMKSEDGGKTWSRIGNRYRHVDDHALWVNPENTDNILIGCDGGIYESSDGGEYWTYKANLPITQFYKVSIDKDKPFYNIYGGTQDNNTIGGPSRTINEPGIMNSDWFITIGGDGFEPAIDPEDPDIVYSQSQYGWLFRYDKASGESVLIKPQEREIDEPYRWNWDSPLLISPHDNERLYFAANRVFRSDNRGDTWEVISPDLTRQLNRNEIPVMGRVWGVDAVMKNKSTSIYGAIVELSESPLKEGLLYAGTDDGLVQVTEDGGDNWREIDDIPWVPEKIYVDALEASKHNEGTVYVAFNNHKNGDFKPYLYKSTNRGESWESISGNLPEKGAIYSFAEDPVNPDLLFVGTEYGAFFTIDGGEKWVQLSSGLPTINVRDMAIHEEEVDLVLGTFGRGFYVLDDYTPLRNLKEEDLEKEAFIFPVSDSWMFIETNPLGYRGKGFQGSAFYTAENSPVGATFTYYQKVPIKTLKEERKEKEKKLKEKEEDISYPTYEEMREEDLEDDPYLIFVIRDQDSNVVRRLTTSASSTGINRIVWDFRKPTSSPARLQPQDLSSPWATPDVGMWALPGEYTVEIIKYDKGEVTALTDPEPFEIKHLKLNKLAPDDRKEVVAFQDKVANLYRAMQGANSYQSDLDEKLKYLEAALKNTPDAPIDWQEQIRKLELEIDSFNLIMNGNQTLASREFPTTPSMMERIGLISYGMLNTTVAATSTMEHQYEIVASKFEQMLSWLEEINKEVKTLEDNLEEKEAPYTPGRMPDWERQ